MRRILVITAILTLCATSAFAGFDDFNSYSDGNLHGQGDWVKGNSTSWIQVESGMVKIVGGTTGSGGRTTGNEVIGFGLTGTIYVEFDILADENLNTSWGVLADTDGNPVGNLARAYGTAGTVRGRIGDQGIVTGQDPLAAGWNHVQIVIDTAADTDTFYLNGVLLSGTNPISHAGFAGDILQRMSFQKVEGGQDVYLDNLWVGNTPIPEPASMLALLTGLVGIVGFARRKK